MKQKHLSKPQFTILQKMANGYELGVSRAANSPCWLQRGGLGKGGETISVSSATYYALLERRLIEENEKRTNHHHIAFQLSELGKQIVNTTFTY